MGLEKVKFNAIKVTNFYFINCVAGSTDTNLLTLSIALVVLQVDNYR